jgi:membrane protein
MASAASPPGGLSREIYRRFSEDEATTMASSLAYYTIFSLAPLLVIVITVAGFFWGAEAVRGRIGAELEGIVGSGGREQLAAMMSAASQRDRGTWTSLLGIALIVFGATGVVAQLQVALNKIWRVTPDARTGGIWRLIHTRILSFAMILGIAFLLIVSLVVTTALAAVGDQLEGRLSKDVSKAVLVALNLAVSLAVLSCLFAGLFKWMPDARSRWRDVLLGGTLTAALFILGKFLLGLYLGHQNRSAYGPAAALVLILIWVYYSSLVLFFGAEFTRAWAERHGHAPSPKEGAVRLETPTGNAGKS